MSVNLKITLGVVNYLNYVHVTAAKVSSPMAVAWETWIPMPVSNYNFIIPGLDPENYYVTYYEASTDSDPGTLIAQLVINALSGDTLYERRFYTTGGANPGDPADGDNSITDPYLINKTVTGTFKEGFRFFEPITEFSFDGTMGKVLVLNGTVFATNEKFAVELQYNTATVSAPTPNGLYTGNIDVPDLTRTMLTTEINSRLRLVGTAPTQVITLPPLAAIAIDTGYYFDNSVGGTAVQVKILTDTIGGTDRINFNGFNAASNLFAEFWVSQGEHLLLRKKDDSYWEVITDYKGVQVGEQATVSFVTQAGFLPFDGSQIDGNQYGRLWWWVNNVLPLTHKIVDDSGTQIPSRRGQFIVKPTAKELLMPNFQNTTKKGLADFNNYGTDGTRLYDYPGGFQNELIGQHTHSGLTGDTASHASSSSALSGFFKWLVGLSSEGNGTVTNSVTGNVTGFVTNSKAAVENIGVIFGIKI